MEHGNAEEHYREVDQASDDMNLHTDNKSHCKGYSVS